ncbi:MAG: hypothetical protein ACLFVO_02585 [Chloroflexaceae bacterium]
MREQLEQRLAALKAEFDAGQKLLTDLEQKQANLRQTLLRISGAIQVLEEELGKTTAKTAPPDKTNNAAGLVVE